MCTFLTRRLLAVLIALAAGVVAQTAPDDATIIRTTTRLVTVNVLVRDKNGPVTDLKRDDFLLRDPGKPRQVLLFDVNAGFTARPKPNAPELNLFTNTVENGGDSAAIITVILFDGLNTRIADQLHARRSIERLLAGLKPHDRVAIYTLGRTLSILSDFTSEAVRTSAALAKYHGRGDSNSSATSPQQSGTTGKAKLDALIETASRNMTDCYQLDSVRTTALALEAIADHLAPLPGRKSLVWVSNGFPFAAGTDENGFTRPTADRRTFGTEIERAQRAVNRADIAIYPVDARGLTGLSADMKAEGATTSVQARTSALLTPKPAHQETMRMLADETGGRAYYNTNDIGSALHDIIDRAGATYTLGFYPSPDTLDGRYHDLHIDIPARPSLTIASRKGYYAATGDIPETDSVQAAIDTAVWSPLDARAISIVARLKRAGDSLEAEISVSPRQLSLQETDAGWSGMMDVVTAQYDGARTVLFAGAQTTAVRLSREAYAASTEQELRYTASVKLNPAARQLRIIVVDRNSAASGSVLVPITEIR